MYCFNAFTISSPNGTIRCLRRLPVTFSAPSVRLISPSFRDVASARLMPVEYNNNNKVRVRTSFISSFFHGNPSKSSSASDSFRNAGRHLCFFGPLTQCAGSCLAIPFLRAYLYSDLTALSFLHVLVAL